MARSRLVTVSPLLFAMLFVVVVLSSSFADCLVSLSLRAIGQMVIMGWDGTEVTPQIRHLIEEHHLGSILLTAKNLKCVFRSERRARVNGC